MTLKIQDEQLSYIDSVLEYGGKSQRTGDLFGDSGSMSAGAKRIFNSMFGEDVKNVFLQHKSWLNSSILD